MCPVYRRREIKPQCNQDLHTARLKNKVLRDADSDTHAHTHTHTHNVSVYHNED